MDHYTAWGTFNGKMTSTLHFYTIQKDESAKLRLTMINVLSWKTVFRIIVNWTEAENQDSVKWFKFPLNKVPLILIWTKKTRLTWSMSLTIVKQPGPFWSSAQPADLQAMTIWIRIPLKSTFLVKCCPKWTKRPSRLGVGS